MPQERSHSDAIPVGYTDGKRTIGWQKTSWRDVISILVRSLLGVVPLEQRFPNFFEYDPNLSLMKILRPKSQTAYVNMKKMSVWMILIVHC